MKKIFLSTVFLLSFSWFFILNSFVQAQTITTGVINGPLCSGNSINISYSITGTFNAGNVFTVQIDSTLSFVSHINIGTLSSASSGTIHATIPSNYAIRNDYRIRVIGSGLSRNCCLCANELRTFFINRQWCNLGT